MSTSILLLPFCLTLQRCASQGEFIIQLKHNTTETCPLFIQDFYQMFLHHLTTLALLSFAYTVNMLQIGVLIALVHDLSDLPLEVS